jgi:hypothetical protein
MKFKITTSQGRTFFSNEENSALAEKFADLHDGEEIAAITEISEENTDIKKIKCFQCSDGTLYLDEKDAISREADIKLNLFIEEKVAYISEQKKVSLFFENLTKEERIYLINLLTQIGVQ